VVEKAARCLKKPGAVKRQLLLLLLAFGACKKPTDDGQSQQQRDKSKQTDEASKKGALTEQLDPQKDLATQKRNLERLHLDYKGSKAAGNHAAVWAVKWDIHRTEKLIKKDEQLIAQGETKPKKDVENPNAAKAESKGRAQ
jgi:hypothetical protein